MAPLDPLFRPLPLKGVTIPNRFLSTSHAPGYAVHGNITERYIAYESEKAKGGVGLVQFGGATAVSIENSFHYGQINGSVDAVIPQYRRMAAALHGHGAVCTVQLTHGGRRERWDDINWLPAFAPSPLRELIHRSFPAEMEAHDFRRIRDDYAAAVRRARDGDLDGVEISTQAGTLIEQFWSPLMNRRRDGYGGSLANRMRFGLEVLESCRQRVGDDYIIGIRMPGDERLAGGLNQEDCLEIARTYAASGLVDFISVVGGTAVDYKASAEIWPTMWLPSAPYLKLAAAIRAEVAIPILHATRITDAATAVHAVTEGLVDMVGMTRAFLADPHHVAKLRQGREAEIRPCVGAGYCVDRVLMGKDALCLHNVATGRERDPRPCRRTFLRATQDRRRCRRRSRRPRGGAGFGVAWPPRRAVRGIGRAGRPDPACRPRHLAARASRHRPLSRRRNGTARRRCPGSTPWLPPATSSPRHRMR